MNQTNMINSLVYCTLRYVINKLVKLQDTITTLYYNPHQLSCDHTTTNNTTLPFDNNTHFITERRVSSMLNKEIDNIKITITSSKM